MLEFEMDYPPMLIKSNVSMKTASMLASSKNPDYWTSSVHCSYYSLLQMMIHLLVDVKNPPLSIEDLIKKGDSHMRIRDAVIMEIGSKTERTSFMTGFDLVKRMRVKADYTPEQFRQEECLEIKEKSESLRNKAIKYFKK